MADIYDALVIGGGPGGLTGALYLARFRRRVRVVDDGCSRATRIPRSHNMPGYLRGVPGNELVAAIRKQASVYGAELSVGRVEALERVPTGFVAVLADGTRLLARSVLLATGVSDVEPSIPYLVDAVRGGSLRYCPVCDGYEIIDKAIGVLANSEAGIDEALYLRSFTARLHVFRTSNEFRIEDHARRLAEAGIRWIPEPIDSIHLSGEEICIRHGAAETRCDSVYSSLGIRIHADLSMGAETDESGYLLTDRHQKTSIDGLYAAGDVAQGVNQISVAAGGAAIAASAMHLVLGPAWRQ
jgi:thioredoxin reductase (NADPH)